jgi:hypothetical protein
MFNQIDVALPPRRFAAACIAGYLLLASEARALDPAKAISQYVHDAW